MLEKSVILFVHYVCSSTKLIGNAFCSFRLLVVGFHMPLERKITDIILYTLQVLQAYVFKETPLLARAKDGQKQDKLTNRARGS